jgi:heme-degrading monooxygenase HmoA
MPIAATPATPYYAVIFTSLRATPARHTDDAATLARHTGGAAVLARHTDGAAKLAEVAGDDGYGAMADIMAASAARQSGYLGVESAREEVGITVSYWNSLDAILAWKNDSEHLLAQRLGRQGWYDAYQVRICHVERDYGFTRG